jgi:hypothetical protein
MIHMQVIQHELLDLDSLRTRRSLRFQQRTELRLPARAPQIDDQIFGDIERHLPAEVVFDHRERQIDARRVSVMQAMRANDVMPRRWLRVRV